MKHRLMFRFLLTCLALAPVQSRGSHPAAQVPEAYKVKAVFLFHFARFVEWPAGSFSGPDDPMVIGVLGEDPFGQYLDEVVSGEVINGHPLQIRRFSRPEDIDQCHILFVNAEGMGQIRTVLKQLEARAMLTVGDSPAFIRAGGMIRFYSEDSKIRLQINPDAARSSGLMISSKLLRLADISTPKS